MGEHSLDGDPPMSPEEQIHRALIEQLVDAELAEWRSHQESITRITSRGRGVLEFLTNSRSAREPCGDWPNRIPTIWTQL